jgi:hypothetical protein
MIYRKNRRSGLSRLKTDTIKQPSIDSRLRAVDSYGAHDFRIVGCGTYTPNDGIGEALLPHGFEAGEQQARTDAVFSRLGLDASRAEEIATRHVVAGESDNSMLLDRDEAGDRLAREGDIGLTSPTLAEILPHPGDNFGFLRSQRAAYLNTLFEQLRERLARVWQVIELYEHVHGIETVRGAVGWRHACWCAAICT